MSIESFLIDTAKKYSMDYKIVEELYNQHGQGKDMSLFYVKLKQQGTLYKVTEDDIDNCWQYQTSYLKDLLNGEYSLEDAREDLLSLINSKHDNRSKANE